jgi:hypothetical protein
MAAVVAAIDFIMVIVSFALKLPMLEFDPRTMTISIQPAPSQVCLRAENGHGPATETTEAGESAPPRT